MTRSSKLIAGRCVVVTTKASSIKPQIDALLEQLKASHKLLIDFAYLEEIFPNADADPDKFQLLVHQLIHSQLAIVDLSVTADSYYIMGIRHALTNSPTLMLAPNSNASKVANSRFTETEHKYFDVSDPNWMDGVEAAVKYLGNPQLAEYQSDLRATRAFKVSALEPPFSESKLHPKAWQLNASGNPAFKTAGPKIVIWEYQIQYATGFDVWVNSENTYMEMARFWDRSVSAQIRKLGAVRRGSLGDDHYKDALGLALAEKVGTRSQVPIGKVFMTRTDPASSLRGKRKVSHVAHVAAVTPNKVGDGFSSGGEIDHCVRSVFKEIRDERRKLRGRGLRSVLFPLIGSGDGGAHPAFVGHQMVISLGHLISEHIANPDANSILDKISTIGLIAYQPSHLDFLRRELANNDFVGVPLGSGDHA